MALNITVAILQKNKVAIDDEILRLSAFFWITDVAQDNNLSSLLFSGLLKDLLDKVYGPGSYDEGSPLCKWFNYLRQQSFSCGVGPSKVTFCRLGIRMDHRSDQKRDNEFQRR